MDKETLTLKERISIRLLIIVLKMMTDYKLSEEIKKLEEELKK